MTKPPTNESQNDRLIRCGKILASKVVSSLYNDAWKIEQMVFKECYKYIPLLPNTWELGNTRTLLSINRV